MKRTSPRHCGSAKFEELWWTVTCRNLPLRSIPFSTSIMLFCRRICPESSVRIGRNSWTSSVKTCAVGEQDSPCSTWLIRNLDINETRAHTAFQSCATQENYRCACPRGHFQSV